MDNIFIELDINDINDDRKGNLLNMLFMCDQGESNIYFIIPVQEDEEEYLERYSLNCGVDYLITFSEQYDLELSGINIMDWKLCYNHAKENNIEFCSSIEKMKKNYSVLLIAGEQPDINIVFD